MFTKRWIRVCVGVLAVAVLAGCYRKVVSASGYGADRVQVEEGNGPPPEAGSRTLGYPKYAPKKLPGE